MNSKYCGIVGNEPPLLSSECTFSFPACVETPSSDFAFGMSATVFSKSSEYELHKRSQNINVQTQLLRTQEQLNQF